MTITEVAVGDLNTEALTRIRDYVDPMGVNTRSNELKARNVATYQSTRAANVNFEHLVQFSDDYNAILEAALAAVDSERMRAAAEKIDVELNRHVELARVFKSTYSEDDTRPALDFLDEQLQDVMRVVRDQKPALSGVTDARSAHRAGGAAQDAWAELEYQAERYEEIRRVQRSITIRLSTEDGRQWRSHVLGRSGHLKQAFDYEAFWTKSRLIAYRTGSRGLENGEQEFIDWVKSPQLARFDRDGAAAFPDDAIGYLRWISDGDKAWVPDVDELMRVDDLAEAFVNGAAHLKARQDAKSAYYDDRGLTPTEPQPSFQDARGRIVGGSFE